MKDKKIYSGVEDLPCFSAPETVVPGCIVLEGGAFRGVYGEGVLDAMMAAGLNLECTVGVSAGALNGMNYVSGQVGRAARINLRYRYDSRYVGLRALGKNKGIIGFQFCFGEMDHIVPFDAQRFYRPDRRFYAVVTNCLTGESAYLEKNACRDIFQAVRASASMPYLSKMVDLDGVPCLDGGCSTKIAYQWALDQNFDKIVIVRTRHRDWRYKVKEHNSMPYRFYRKYPAFAKVLAGSEERYNQQCEEIARLEQEGRVFVIGPSRDMQVGRLERDMEKLGASYHLGYQDALDRMDDLKAYLS